MSYLDYRKRVYQELLSKIDKDGDIKSLRKHIVKEINHIEYLKSYE